MYRWECANCRCPITGSTFVPGNDGSGYAPVYTGPKLRDDGTGSKKIQSTKHDHCALQKAVKNGTWKDWRHDTDPDTRNEPHKNTTRRKEKNEDKQMETKLASMQGPDESERGAEDSDSSDDTSYTKGKKKGNGYW
jgi:hypothetical protein